MGMHKLLWPEFSSYTDEVKAQNPCTFLPRHSTDITEYISFQSPLRAPKLQNVTLLAFLLYINHLPASQKREDINWECVSAPMWECARVCICVCIRLGGRIKAAGEACLQSFKIWTSLLCLSCWQFSSESLVQTVPYSKKIIWILGKALCETFSEHSLNQCGLAKWWITHRRLESSSMLSQCFFFFFFSEALCISVQGTNVIEKNCVMT